MGRPKGVFKKIKKSRAVNFSSLKVACSPDQVVYTSTPPSASRMKIQTTYPSCSEDENATNSGFRLIDLSLLSASINSSCCCSRCGKRTVRIIDEDKRYGIVCNLHIICDSCEADTPFKTSSSVNWNFEANVRLVYAFRSLGVGREGANLFCGLMNMPAPSTRFFAVNNLLLQTLAEVCNASLQNAAKEAVKENDSSSDLSVSCDGTWMRRGHKSLHGVSSVISVDTGKVLDLQVLSKYCYECSVRKQSSDPNKEAEWMSEHKKSCCKNYDGSSGGMEAAGMTMIFNRSEEKHGVRYVKYLGDGDSSAFKKVREQLPYGENCTIEKLECIGHVQKRMGGKLRRLVQDFKGKKLEDNKPINGKNRLTDKRITQLQSYYGLAIRSNITDVEEMKKAVWATFFHTLSTNENPVHGLCSESWCKFKKMKALGQSYDHNHSLPMPVMNAIKPVFRALSDKELLKKCCHGRTQNANESFNNLIWIRCPKNKFASSKIVRIAACDAAVTFNDGNIGRVKVLQKIGFSPGIFMLTILKGIDDYRIAMADSAVEKMSNFALQMKTSKRKPVEGDEKEEYEYGGF